MKTKTCLLILLLVAVYCNYSYAQKHQVKRIQAVHKPKIHPYTNLLINEQENQSSKRNTDNNRLLVLLIDFQIENPDNPLSTGNGKFFLEADSTYRTTIGSPPHDKEYFEANLDALRYYYLAASHNTFNLNYDVWPKNRTAYTLSHPMSYYNPAGASSALFLSRIEEYFKEAFELADAEDPSIDFGSYGHFMIIHAGSDWQHDVMGDTPVDIPSFFIKVADGKEAVVEGGNVRIRYACNVPSTIAQDFDSYESDDITYYTGYGALNGVLAHEFGHSLGFVDLYNTYNFSPMVGQFDIMDSGGGVITEHPDEPGVLIEGELPCLPGAFSRAIAFGEIFKQNGLMDEIDSMIGQYDLSENIQIAASSKKQTQGHYIPNIYKIPLNEDEYLLVENRSVDPDRDGFTSIKGTLNGRVALYPTPYGDENNTPTYEYDYLLPSFIDNAGNVIGGGLLVWHIDNKVLYKQGVVNSEGVFVTNFDRNTVNGGRSRRGVKIVEADGLDDLGNDYSWFWTGTAYEYFHKYKPQLGSNGLFQSWTFENWRPVLNSESTPPLTDNLGNPVFWGLKDISQPSAQMSFKLSASIFNSINTISGLDTLHNPLPLINSNFAKHVLPVKENGYIQYYFYDSEIGLDQWTELLLPTALALDNSSFESLVSDADNDSYQELIIPQYNGFYSIELRYDEPEIIFHNINASDTLTTAPLYAFGKIWVATKNNLYSSSDTNNPALSLIDINGGVYNLAADNANLLLLQKNNLLIFDPVNQTIIENHRLPETFTRYEPVIVKVTNDTTTTTIYILVSDTGNIYKCSQGILTCLFRNQDKQNNPTNIAVSKLGTYSPVIVFGLADKLYAIKTDGTLLPDFPVFLEGISSDPYSHLIIRSTFNKLISYSQEIIYLPMLNGGYLALNSDGSINRLSSMIDIKDNTSNRLFWDNYNDKLFWIFNSNHGMLLSAELDNQAIYPLIWSGYRNGDSGYIQLDLSQPSVQSNKINVFAFPNPAKDNWINLRIENPSGKVSINVYDISGKLIRKMNYHTDSVDYKDVQLDVSGYSSGVYIAVVETRNKIKRCKFAIQK